MHYRRSKGFFYEDLVGSVSLLDDGLGLRDAQRADALHSFAEPFLLQSTIGVTHISTVLGSFSAASRTGQVALQLLASSRLNL